MIKLTESINIIVPYISDIFLLIGLFFVITGIVGCIRMPDFYTKIHASSVADSCGTIFILVGASIKADTGSHSIKILLIIIFALLSNPIINYALAQACLKSGVGPIGNRIEDVIKND